MFKKGKKKYNKTLVCIRSGKSKGTAPKFKPGSNFYTDDLKNLNKCSDEGTKSLPQSLSFYILPMSTLGKIYSL